MPDDILTLDVALEAAALLDALRTEERHRYRLVSAGYNPSTRHNEFGFDLLPASPSPDAAYFLQMATFPEAVDAMDRAARKKEFADFGSQIAADGVLFFGPAPVYVIYYRGELPEWPRPHAPAPPLPLPLSLPEHVRPIFAPEGPLGSLPWARASSIPLKLDGLKGHRLTVFRNAYSGKVDAFVMVTDAEINTDGPGGSKAVDPWWSPQTALTHASGAPCNSRQFPGVVRSIKLRTEPLGLQMGDLAYVCYRGKTVACQVYTQGADEKIGEISLQAARAIGLVPAEMTEHDAAVAASLTKELVTVCFPGSASRVALPASEIATEAKKALVALASQSAFPLAASLRPITTDGCLNIYSRKSWAALRPKTASFKTADALGMVLHHTTDRNRLPLSNEEAEVAEALELSRRMQHDHMFRRGWSDIGHHFTVSRGGIIMEARSGTLAAARHGQVVRGAHAGVPLYNNQWWGIELEGDYRKEGQGPTDKQTAALQALCHWLGSLIEAHRFNPNRHLIAHCQAKPDGTDCPGHLREPSSLADYLTMIRHYLMSQGETVSPPDII